MESVVISNSENGFCSSVLGPWWFVLHMKSFDYAPRPTFQQRREMEQWFLSYLKAIPCSACKNLDRILEDTGWDPQIDLATRQTFVIYVWRLHNELNTRLRHPFYPLQNLITYMESLRATECSPDRCTIRSRFEPHAVITIEHRPARATKEPSGT